MATENAGVVDSIKKEQAGAASPVRTIPKLRRSKP
jgi:hypothetical protein